MKNLKRELLKRDDRVTTLQCYHGKLKEEVQACRKQFQQFAFESQKVETMQDIIEQQQEAITEMARQFDSDIKTVTARMNYLSVQYTTLEEQQVQVLEENKEQRNKLTAAGEEISRLEEKALQLAATEERLSQLQLVMDQCSQNLELSQKGLAQSKLENADIEIRMTELQQSKDCAIAALKVELDALHKELETQVQRAENEGRDKESAHEMLRNCQSEYRVLEEKCKGQETILSRVDGMSDRLQKNLEDSDARYNALNKDFLTLQAIHVASDVKLAAAQESVEELKKSNKAHTAEEESLKLLLKDKITHIQEQDALLASLQKQQLCAQNDAMSQEAINKQQLAEAAKQNQVLEAQNAKLREEMRQTVLENTSITTELLNVRQEVSNQQSSYTRSISELQEQLQKFQSQQDQQSTEITSLLERVDKQEKMNTAITKEKYLALEQVRRIQEDLKIKEQEISQKVACIFDLTSKLEQKESKHARTQIQKPAKEPMTYSKKQDDASSWEKPSSRSFHIYDSPPTKRKQRDHIQETPTHDKTEAPKKKAMLLNSYNLKKLESQNIVLQSGVAMVPLCKRPVNKRPEVTTSKTISLFEEFEFQD